MPYNLPFGGLSTALALAIKTGKWVGALMAAFGATLLALGLRSKR